ncbi:hypothetical protein PoB_005444500 [Plakobranchus ocellatus]|uniref:Uncharacterized protein n=1 Tax=Plakobranchus ocellatus TaxID=259542 RepID=A0AAV4C5F3_9GAST|nr:hypothetical protein PoB_005444500 [Plakobranchus ocellatus]
MLCELIRGWRNGENMEFEDRVQIKDDVVDVFNITVVGKSAIFLCPWWRESVIDVPNGESAVVDVPGGESAGVDVPDVEGVDVDVPGGESAFVTLEFEPVRTKGRPKCQDRNSRFGKRRKLATVPLAVENAAVDLCALSGVCGEMEVAREFCVNGMIDSIDFDFCTQ